MDDLKVNNNLYQAQISPEKMKAGSLRGKTPVQIDERTTVYVGKSSTPEQVATIRAKYLAILCFVLMVMVAPAQVNMILNGTMDGPGPLAQPWQINAISTPTLTDGVQRVDSPFAAELFQSVQLGQGNYILNFDLQCSYYAQVMLYVDSINGYVISINPIPYGEMTHYSIAFTVYDTCIMIKWRTIPNYATYLKLDNVTLTQSYPVGIYAPTESSITGDNSIYDLMGRRLSERPQHGFYIQHREVHYAQ